MSAFRRTLKLLPTIHRTYVNRSPTCSTLLPSNKKPRTMITVQYNTSRDIHTSSVRATATVPFKLSDIGEGIAEVTIKEWYVSVGDEVAQFDNICEVQSDKATVTITCRYDGIVRAVHFGVDETCKVGQALVDIEVTDEEAENLMPSTPAVPSTPTPEPAISTFARTVSTPSDQPVPPTNPVPASDKREILTTPAVRKMAADKKVDLSLVPATGKGNRITKEDLLNFIASPPQIPLPQKQEFKKAAAAPSQEEEVVTIPTAHIWNTSLTSHVGSNLASTQDRIVDIKGIARVMVNTMNAAQTVPRFTYHDEYPVDKLMKLKKIMKEVGKEHRVKLTFMPLLIKAASQALIDFPMVNAHVNADCTAITYKAAHNIGIATDTPHGLMVPNIKNVQNLSILDIASELNRLKTLSESNKLSMDDVTGGTFSLSNVGAVGGTYASPLLVVPEVCIGAFGKIQTRPAFNSDGEVVASSTMCVSWSGDHRVLDGATVARYSNTLRKYLENPTTLLFHLK